MGSISFINLRVFIEEEVHPIYLELTRGSIEHIEDIPFTKMSDLFVAAACIGAKENKFKELGSHKRDIFVADALNPRFQIPVLMALTYKRTNNLEDLQNPKLILDICQAWANGGIRILQEQVSLGQGLRPLYRLVDFILNEMQFK